MEEHVFSFKHSSACAPCPSGHNMPLKDNGFIFVFLTLFYTLSGGLESHALTLKNNTAKYYFGEKSSFCIPS